MIISVCLRVLTLTFLTVKNGFLLTMQGEGVGTILDGAVAIEGNTIPVFEAGSTHEVEVVLG